MNHFSWSALREVAWLVLLISGFSLVSIGVAAGVMVFLQGSS